MFAGSIRRRLVSIVIIISILSAVVVAAIVINSVAGTLRRQTESAFVEHNQALANMLDTQLQSIATTARALADTMEHRAESPVTLLWPTANNMLDGDSTLERINVYTSFRDGHQIVMFRRPQEPSSIAPMAHYINNPLPSTTWFLNTIEGFRRGQESAWHGPERGFLGDRRPVISVAVPYRGTSAQSIGVIWVDVTTDTIEAIMREQFNVEVQPGYSLLVSDTGGVVATFDLPALNTLSTVPTAIDGILSASAANQNVDTSAPATIDDPFNEGRPAFVIRSQMPFTGWQLISVVPQFSLQSSFSQGVFQTAFVILLGTIVLGWMISRFADVTLSRPLLNMSTAAQEIGSGDMRYHVGYQTRKDEVGRLARALEDSKI